MLTAQKSSEKFWIGTQPDPKDRRIIKVSVKDAAKIREFHGDLAAKAEVTDLVTGEKVVIGPASCGLDCNCALDFR